MTVQLDPTTDDIYVPKGWYRLTPDEMDAARAASRRMSDPVKEFIKERGGLDAIGATTSVHQKIAADAKAETDAVIAIEDRRRRLGDDADRDDWRRRAVDAESRLKMTDLELSDARAALARKTAEGSMAVNSDD